MQLTLPAEAEPREENVDLVLNAPIARHQDVALRPAGLVDEPRVRDPACGAQVAPTTSAGRLTTGPGPTDPSRSTRGSSGDSPRSVSTTLPSRRPVPGSASATSSSPIRASAPRSLAVGFANIVECSPAPANHQGVRFSVATNGRPTVVTNIASQSGVNSPRQRVIGTMTSCHSPNHITAARSSHRNVPRLVDR